MPEALRPDNEAQRLHSLRALCLLDTLPEERFNRITRIVRSCFGVPVALISLVDENRQWFKSCQGLDISETPRDVAFCAHAILADETLCVEDARNDPRFSDNALVTGAPHIRFYAGAPLLTADNSRIGTLCIIDYKPRSFSAAELATLRDLADCVQSEMSSMSLAKLELEERARANFLREITAAIPGIVYQFSIDTHGQRSFPFISDASHTILMTDPHAIMADPHVMFALAHPDDLPDIESTIADSYQQLEPWNHAFRFSVRGTWRWIKGHSIPQQQVDGSVLWNGVLFDVTDQIEAAQQLKLINQNLHVRVANQVSELRHKDSLLIQQSRQAAMGEMLGMIAHQWRQPLNAMSMLFANVEDAFASGDLDASLVNCSMSKGRELIQQMSSTITDFRYFFQPHRQHSDFSLQTLVTYALSLCGPSLQQAGIQVDVQPVAEAQARGSPNEFLQVLLVLLQNAREALMEKQDAHRHVRIKLCVDNANACVSISDNGPGIPDNIMPHVFEPYYTSKKDGSGIGLHMAKTIIEVHMHGTIVCRNNTYGAEFIIHLPLLNASNQA